VRTDRLETFADGVFAIAATLLLLLHPPGLLLREHQRPAGGIRVSLDHATKLARPRREPGGRPGPACRERLYSRRRS
jgi:hypothetical protein